VWCPIYKAGSTAWMEIFATIGGVMTPKNHMRLSKGLIQINQLARMVYPKTADTKATMKVKYVTLTITGTVKYSEYPRM
jgi:hypothetical protein